MINKASKKGCRSPAGMCLGAHASRTAKGSRIRPRQQSVRLHHRLVASLDLYWNSLPAILCFDRQTNPSQAQIRRSAMSYSMIMKLRTLQSKACVSRRYPNPHTLKCIALLNLKIWNAKHLTSSSHEHHALRLKNRIVTRIFFAIIFWNCFSGSHLACWGFDVQSETLKIHLPCIMNTRPWARKSKSYLSIFAQQPLIVFFGNHFGRLGLQLYKVDFETETPTSCKAPTTWPQIQSPGVAVYGFQRRVRAWSLGFKDASLG